MGKMKKGQAAVGAPSKVVAPKYDQLAALRLIAKDIPNMTTVSQIAEEYVVPTIMTSLNRATGLGGWPLRRLAMVHGKNSTGKSVFALLVLESMRRMGHLAALEEAEFSAEREWYNSLVMGEGTLFDQPANLDELIKNIFKMLENLSKGKSGDDPLIPKEVGCCLVVDTLTKLVPKEQFEKVLEEGISKGYSLQAQWVSLWSKVIVPLIARSNSSLLLVMQERVNMGAKPFQKQRKVTMGEALLYDVSMRIECTHSKTVVQGGEVVATQFFYDVEKNKSDGWTDQKGSFFTSTGKGDTPAGFDVAREALEEARYRKLLCSRKVRKVDVMHFGDEELVKGGMEDVRKLCLKEPKVLEHIIDELNRQSRRVKE